MRFRLHIAVPAVAFLQLAAAYPLASQDAEVPLDDVRRTAVVDSVAALVGGHYVVPDTGRMIADHLRDRQRAGAYAGTASRSALAKALTTDLQALNGDWHLHVKHDRKLAAAWARRLEPGSGGESSEAQRALLERERQANYGFDRAEVLDGNVGYVKMNVLAMAPEAQERAAQAFGFVGSTDAVILDLRGVPGGSAAMSNAVISHFVEPGVPSLSVYWSNTGETVLRRTLEEVPGPRRTEVPLFVLVDRGSGSAAEDVPFVLQNLGRATIVGETTAGAGRNNAYFPAGEGMAVSISISRVTEPGTGREWEGVGVVPDIVTSSDDALSAAHAAALEKLGRAPSPATERF